MNMSIITDEQFNQFVDDSRWLHKNYNELINEFNLEYIAIRNHMIIAHHKEMNEFGHELRQLNIDRLDVVVEFVRDKKVKYKSCMLNAIRVLITIDTMYPHWLQRLTNPDVL
jgi:hypothetical protein